MVTDAKLLAADRRIVRTALRKCTVRGDFALSSGGRSAYRIEVDRAVLGFDVFSEVGHLLAAALADLGELDAAGGPAVGAVPLVTALQLETARHVKGFYVRPLGQSLQDGRDAVGGMPPSPGDRVVVLEDVVTTGSAALHACRVAESLGAKVVRVLTLVDREEGAGELGRWYDFKAVFTARELLAAEQ